MAPADSGSREAAGDLLAAYLATIPRGLSAAAWARWRGKNPPPYLETGNRQAGRCGVCGGQLSAWLRLCSACSRREFDYVAQLPQQVKPPPPPVRNVRPAGSVLRTVTGPLAAPEPALVTRIE